MTSLINLLDPNTIFKSKAKDSMSGCLELIFSPLFSICASEKQQQSSSSFKEVLKLVLQLMIDDIWSNYDNYSIQQKVIE